MAGVGWCHRKNAVRLLGEHERSTGRSVPRGRRIYDEAVRQALIVAWEASGRICGKRLKASPRPAQYGPVPGEARSSRLDPDPDPDVRERPFSASASTMDRVLRPVRERAGSRRRLNPNPPKDTDGRREGSGRGVRELPGRWPGLHWGRWEVGGRSSVAAQGPYGRLRELRCAGWRENTQQGTLADRGGASLRGRWVSCRLAVRPGVEWLAAGPRRE